jgi:hypothetical protein
MNLNRSATGKVGDQFIKRPRLAAGQATEAHSHTPDLGVGIGMASGRPVHGFIDHPDGEPVEFDTPAWQGDIYMSHLWSLNGAGEKTKCDPLSADIQNLSEDAIATGSVRIMEDRETTAVHGESRCLSTFRGGAVG